MIHETAIIYPNVTIGKNVYIGPYCIIGSPAENKKTWLQEGKGVIIGDNTVITKATIIDTGVDVQTTIGKDCFICAGVYIGHDSFVMDSVTISPNVNIGGYVSIGFGANLGMGVSVHQFSNVPKDCMIGMNSTITKKSKLKPNSVYVGSPVKYLRSNEK